MPGDRTELENHIREMLDAVEADFPDVEWSTGGFCTILEVILPTEEGEGEDGVRMALRSRFKGGPVNTIGLLRLTEAQLRVGALTSAQAKEEES